MATYEYKILTGTRNRYTHNSAQESLVSLVNDAIKHGWIPQGGIAISVEHDSDFSKQIEYATQAMIKITHGDQ